MFPNPFDELGPSPLARRAAQDLQVALRSHPLEGAEEGKMFGVLVARAPDGQLHTLRAFSGMLNGRWRVEGFAPPLCDLERRARFEPAGEAAVKALLRRHEALASSPERAALRAEVERQARRHAEEREALRARHEENRRRRRAARETKLLSAEALHALDQQSRGDKAERRRLDAAQEAERAALLPRLARLERRLRALERLRQFVCRSLMRRLHDTYEVPNARGERKGLREVFAPREPPSGAGDCAAPKLLAQAYARGLTPLALAEFWWGAPPLSGGRLSGEFYPACREKCGPLLPFMLEGLEVAPPKVFRVRPRRAELSIVFEDAWLVVVAKPEGLLSIPGKDAVGDSVLERLRARHPGATGPLLVHRLDLDTSGLLVAALDARTHAALQKQFLRREVHKRYAAWVEGAPGGERGTIELAMRVDLEDRPRQIHDPVHGKRAVTDWEVVERAPARTKVALFPRTGRTHQLRVHAAHPLGLGAPIVGDRLYGRPGERLLLHAEELAFIHPATGERVRFSSPPPF